MQTCTSYAAAIIILLTVNAKADEPQPAESSWTDLVEQSSRQQLFEQVVQASLAEEALQPNPTPPPNFGLPKDFFFPDDVRFDKTRNNAPRQGVIFGIDVSHYTGTSLNLSTLNVQKIDFVYAKATQGVKFKDPRFGYYWKALAALPGERPLRGAYHFLSALDPGKEQAQRFVQFLTIYGGLQKDDMPPCLDLEWDVTSSTPDQWKGQKPQQILDSVIAWLKTTEELTGRTPMVYTARSWWLERGIPEADFDQLSHYPIWIADYSGSHKAVEKPAVIHSHTQALWQFADDAQLTVGYIEGPHRGLLDASIFYGSRDDFDNTFHITR